MNELDLNPSEHEARQLNHGRDYTLSDFVQGVFGYIFVAVLIWLAIKGLWLISRLIEAL